MKKNYQNFLSVSWENVLSSEGDIIKLLEELKLQNFKDVQIVSRTYTQDNRLVMLISANNKINQPQSIVIDATSEIPTWQQFINVTYEQETDTDIKIILYGKDYDNLSYDLPAGEISDVSNLVRRNNMCNVKTYLVRGVVVDYNGQKALTTCFIVEEPDNTAVDNKQKLPSKIDVQKAEFWTGYYYPNWGDEPSDTDVDIIEDWEPGYSMNHDLSTKAMWDDSGFSLNLMGKPDSEAIKWIWANGKSLFSDEYGNCLVELKSEDDKPYAISVKMLDIPIEELIKMGPADKREYGEYVYSHEHKFGAIAGVAVSEYEKANVVADKAAVA